MTGEVLGIPRDGGRELEMDYQPYAWGQIEELVSRPESKAARAEMWRKVTQVESRLDEVLDSRSVGRGEAVGVIRKVVLEVAGLNEKVRAGLLGHLDEVQAETGKLVKASGDLLDPKEGELLVAVVAPLHDLFKGLGSPSAQVMADHEQIAAHILRKYLPQMGFSQNEVAVEFAGEVVGDHENIYKEAGRRGFMSYSSPVERAKGIFFLADTLTGVVVADRGELMVDEVQLERRFGDLYFRHIDPEVGKVFRPEWGLSAVGDYAE